MCGVQSSVRLIHSVDLLWPNKYLYSSDASNEVIIPTPLHNRYVRHRLSEGRLSTLQLTLQPSTFPEHGIKSGLELPTNLLNFRKVINYIPPQFKIHLFPFNEKNPSLLHLFSMRWCELPGLTTERRKVWESAVGVGVGQLAEALRQSAVGLEGDAGGHAGSERRNREGSLFIMADCLSVWFPAPTHCFP